MITKRLIKFSMPDCGPSFFAHKNQVVIYMQKILLESEITQFSGSFWYSWRDTTQIQEKDEYHANLTS